ncbi:sensor histidine kinase [Flavobacterium sp.]|uniref:sensor histidine kinase n=1 Tax=Flavobacterium sp. TaxID=239 RepID=UPI00263171DA|nr:histidine kinase [Flavobacterium sp.]
MNYFLGYVGSFYVLQLFSPTVIISILFYRIDQRNKKNRLIELQNLNIKKNSEYLQLKQQVNPHFLFNNLNTLISFIEINPKKAIEFGHHLSNTYRHYLKYQEEDFVLLSDEISFIKEYLEIYKAKFENGFSFKINVESYNYQYILSLSLQEIIDNIFKHNSLDEINSIEISIFILDDNLCISNSITFKNSLSTTKLGLENINNRYLLLTDKNIKVTSSQGNFQVAIPILNLER